MEAERSIHKSTLNVSANWTQLPQLSEQLFGALQKLDFSEYPDLIIRVGCSPEGVYIRLQVDGASSTKEKILEPVVTKAEVPKPKGSSSSDREKEREADLHSTKDSCAQKSDPIDEGHLKQFLANGSERSPEAPAPIKSVVIAPKEFELREESVCKPVYQDRICFQCVTLLIASTLTLSWALKTTR